MLCMPLKVAGPYLAGFCFSIIGGAISIWVATGALWKSIGRPRNRADEELHPDPQLPAQVGVLERSLYTASILVGKEQFIAVWLALKMIPKWSWYRPSRGNGRNGTSDTTKEPSDRSVFNIYLIGNGLSIAYGVAGGLIAKCLFDQPQHPIRAGAFALMPLMLSVFIWGSAWVLILRKRLQNSHGEEKR